MVQTLGRGAAALDDCQVVVQGEFEVPRQEHAFLETESGVARLCQNGVLEMNVSTQAPFRDRLEIGHALGLDPFSIRVKAPAMGGGFGGKDGATVQCLLALAALKAKNRPVIMVWDREESFLAGTKRLSGILKYRLGADSDGSLKAIDCEIILDNGAYANLGPEVLGQCMECAAGPYRVAHASISGKAVYTNNPVGGPFRGFGAPQAAFAMEQMIDKLAIRLGLDPLEIRKKNVLEKGDKNALGITLTTSTGIAQCLDTLSAHLLFKQAEDWKKKAPPFRKRGKGLACVLHSVGFAAKVPDYATARIELTRQGRFKIYSGIVDMGQGNAPTYLQIAGDKLNQKTDGLELVLPDTGLCLPSGSSSASRTTYIFGNALIQAAERLEKLIRQRAAMVFMSQDALEDFALLPGLVRHLPSGREMSLASLACMLNESELTATGYFKAPVAPEAREGASLDIQGFGMGHRLFSYGAHLALIELDQITGQIEVAHYLAVTDSGRVLNPQVFEQQIQGGIAQGLGYGLSEDFLLEKGQVLTRDFSTYILPTSLDMPEIVSQAVATHENSGPYGMKGVGELPICGPLPAVANALADACGVRLTKAPLTSERVLTALARAGRLGGEK
jgi:CO/xanthine dehydrogenase Mo-binding subunit